MPSKAILEQKQEVVKQLAESIRNSVAGVIVNYQGITVEDDTKMRKALREAGVKYSVVKNSLISDGCVIEGVVENSILFRGVKVAKGAVVKNSIIMQDNYIGENTTLNCVITDKNVVIGDRKTLSGCSTLPYFIKKGTRI